VTLNTVEIGHDRFGDVEGAIGLDRDVSVETGDRSAVVCCRRPRPGASERAKDAADQGDPEEKERAPGRQRFITAPAGFESSLLMKNRRATLRPTLTAVAGR